MSKIIKFQNNYLMKLTRSFVYKNLLSYLNKLMNNIDFGKIGYNLVINKN